jgi:DNA-binding GntR family transcriptional regulator
MYTLWHTLGTLISTATMPRQRPSLKVIATAPAPSRKPRPAPAGSTERIVLSITEAIVARRLMPGTKLVEQKIADIFKVSRTLVRQALNQLSRDRLVTLEPARGAFVAMPSVDEAHQVFELRQMIEGAMVRRLCATITSAQIAELRSHLVAEQAAVARSDVPGRTRLLADFHVVLARILGNQVLAQMLNDLLSRSSLIALMYQSSQSAEASLAEHVAIVDALERRDVRCAVRLAEGHLAHVERNLRFDPRSPELSQILGFE